MDCYKPKSDECNTHLNNYQSLVNLDLLFCCLIYWSSNIYRQYQVIC